MKQSRFDKWLAETPAYILRRLGLAFSLVFWSIVIAGCFWSFGG